MIKKYKVSQKINDFEVKKLNNNDFSVNSNHFIGIFEGEKSEIEKDLNTTNLIFEEVE